MIIFKSNRDNLQNSDDHVPHKKSLTANNNKIFINFASEL